MCVFHETYGRMIPRIHESCQAPEQLFSKKSFVDRPLPLVDGGRKGRIMTKSIWHEDVGWNL